MDHGIRSRGEGREGIEEVATDGSSHRWRDAAGIIHGKSLGRMLERLTLDPLHENGREPVHDAPAIELGHAPKPLQRTLALVLGLERRKKRVSPPAVNCREIPRAGSQALGCRKIVSTRV